MTLIANENPAGIDTRITLRSAASRLEMSPLGLTKAAGADKQPHPERRPLVCEHRRYCQNSRSSCGSGIKASHNQSAIRPAPMFELMFNTRNKKSPALVLGTVAGQRMNSNGGFSLPDSDLQ
jgi:hypothetical protein